MSVFLCGATACTLRLLLLPISPIPQPYIHDDFSFLLAADTFAHGQLTNPTPALWQHFESFHVDMKPTYMSMYFPAQGMVMAAGQVLAGHPWFGILAACSLMCAAICWMLQGWLPPGWALLGGMIAVIRLALFSYWIDTYAGAGAIAALGGALVLGALPRIKRYCRVRDFFGMGLGMAILATSRPYEGMLISIPTVLALGWWRFKKPIVQGGTPLAGAHGGALKRAPRGVLIRRTMPAVLVLTATFAFMGYYDYRVFGNAFTPPYQINRETYAMAPQQFWFQSARAEPAYRHRIMRDFYSGDEMRRFRGETQSVASLLEVSVLKLLSALQFYFNFALIPPLVMLVWALRDRRMRFFRRSCLFLAVGVAMETFFSPHYLAPAVAMLYAVLLQCMRHLRLRGPSGLFLVRAIPVVCIVLAVLRVYAEPLRISLPSGQQWAQSWYGTAPLGLERARVLAQLESLPGPQLAIVPYSPHHMSNDWVYNGANIDQAKVIWAREMDPASDRKLLNYYKNRTAWLVDPDSNPPTISPFPAAQEAAGDHSQPYVHAE